MKKDRQIEEVNSIISDNKKEQKKKSKNSLHKNNNHHINDNSFGGYSSIEFDSMRDSSNSNKNSKKEIENMKHLKNSFSWSYDSKTKKMKKENEQISILEEEKLLKSCSPTMYFAASFIASISSFPFTFHV